MKAQLFSPGFRLSKLDAVVLAVGAFGAAAAAKVEPWLGAAVGFAIGHFFLFCNVFRISRTLELAWAAAFLGMAGGTVVAQTPGWMITTIATFGVTFAVISVDMCKASYHGIWWERINANLPVWWKANAV